MSTSPLYSHLKARGFRLLLLQAAGTQESLSGSLQEHSLDDPPPYEALSYVWRQSLFQDKDHHLPSQIAGRPDFETFSVRHSTGHHLIYLDKRPYPLTENLAFALWCFRDADKSRLLWIDQVCINQHDIDEKNQQVRLMGSIYESAKSVLVWLGEEIDGVEALFETIHSIPLPKMNPADGILPPQLKKEEILQFESRVQELDSKFYDRIRIICQRPWFRRVWVLQEVALNAKAMIFCGNHALPLSTFSLFLYHLFQYIYKSGSDAISMRLIFDAAAYGRFASLSDRSGKDDLTSLLTLTEACFASDPRDKIYALTGLLSKRYLEHGFEPDYRRSTAEAFTHAFSVHLKAYKKLDILERAQPRRELDDSRLPSWVPNFTGNPETDSKIFLPYKYSQSWSFSAAVDTIAAVDFPFAGCLSITGYIIDEIAHVLEPVPCYPDFKVQEHATEIYSSWLSYLEALKGSKPYPWGGTYEHAYWHTITTDFHKQRLRNSFHECPETTHLRAAELPELHEKMRVNIRSVTEGRRLATTRTGALALCPAASEVGDPVLIFNGGRMPFVVRDIQESENRQDFADAKAFTLIGECFIHGIMYGDALKDTDIIKTPETILLI